jgi:uncharacterized protein (TIGR03032 family)
MNTANQGSTGQNAGQPAQPEAVVSYVYTDELSRFCFERKLSIFVTSYQAQRIMCLSSETGRKMSMLMRVMPSPTGLALEANRMALCSRNQIWFFRTVTEVQGLDGQKMPYDLVYVPRRSHVTGDIAAHQLSWFREELFVVNTRFSCLCTLDALWSFVPVWKPPFISAYAPEDRCHLNGLCLDENGPKYATALGESDEARGWRPNKAQGGVLIDIPSGRTVVRGLCMPHSPILYGGYLWVLESGKGELAVVDQTNGKVTPIVQFPGFLRGLAFYDRYAFVGCSKMRETTVFGGVPIEQRVKELKCAVYVYDISARQTVGFIEFTKGITELFDVKVLAGPRAPHIVGFEDDAINALMVLPPSCTG